MVVYDKARRKQIAKQKINARSKPKAAVQYDKSLP